ncbi:hypothetical protein GCM10010967_30860 [Dyadobacter beijingensis]|uniref:Uncharacterized protein n=1 Tax=Dyadobacter beijingensis TaxID=365489 RepID=A0ABQ2HYJ1_9BACT|nr:hypothetical protein [Dyadobacter beijingensis]GGM95272.1 hypothetical protein GCM10010967_30860 [Dyadobacter beijingensis]
MKFSALLSLTLLLPAYLRASVVILNGLTHNHSISAADMKVQGAIKVKNEGGKDSRILVYRQDLVSPCDQQAAYPEAGSHARSLGAALKTNIDERVIATNEEYDVRYTIDADPKRLPGTYWEVIMVEVADPVREEAHQGIQVNSKVRYAIQVIVDIGPVEGPPLSYEKVAYEKVSAEQSVLKVILKNNGFYGARTNVILEIYDSAGNKLKTTQPNTRMLYPGNCSTFEIPVTEVPKGKYDCVIIADTKKDLFGSNISLQVE